MTATSFITSDGVVLPAVTAEEVREVDRIAIEEIGPTGDRPRVFCLEEVHRTRGIVV